MSETILSDDQIASVMRGMNLPVQPQIMVDLQMEQVMPDPDLNEIARLISRDVAISGRVLKAVNSPFFGLRNTITSIQKAVILLGINSVINIVNAIAVRHELSQRTDLTEQEIDDMNRFWDTAQEVALVCTAIAKQIGFQSPDEAYTLGLFHNAGIPLLREKFSNYHEVLVESYNGKEKRVVDAENNLINTNHAVVGFYIAKSWRLSSNICEAIQQHHNIIELFGQSNNQGSDILNLLSILKMAEHIVGNHKIIGENDTDIEWNESRDVIFHYLGINEEDFEEISVICQDMGI
ncbi:MAG: HDOD domain-containing protein [Gammaproteobacteria bacterium]|nr:HDOD domain-containing protein [Gammaproteobacteria bacterium]